MRIKFNDVDAYLRREHRLHFNARKPSYRGLTFVKAVTCPKRSNVQVSIYQTRGGVFTVILEGEPDGSDVVVDVLPFGDSRVAELLRRAPFRERAS